MLRAGLAALLLAAAAPATASGAVSLAQVGTFTQPVYVTSPPGDTANVYVVEQGGLVRSLDGATFVDLRSAISTGFERGLLSIAFAPDYASSRKLYAYYTAAGDGAITVVEIQGAARRVILRIPHDRQGNHNGGQLQFGPDGALYAGTGDGGAAGDPSGNAQDTTKAPPSVVNGVNHDWRLGKLLRLDLGGGDPQLWAIGLRNPFRFSFDRATGDLVIADVGQASAEEVDFAPAPGRGQGLNFGWDRWEGGQAFEGTGSREGFTFPVITHSHDDGWCSITGGYVVRDPALPELAGQYVYGDWCKGEVWGARLSAAGAADVRALALPKVPRISSFGEDGCGRVYVASLEGPVYRLSSSGACG
ncbi:MAG TPA: PQQ-dependent sugar dehydrogenase, partial [Solirubrobacteraceae bacterium]